MGVDLAGLTVVNLSHVNDPGAFSGYPGDPEFTVDVAATVPADGFYQQVVRQGEHSGTHWGAPAHMNPDGRTADQLAPGDLFLPVARIDVRDRVAADADYGVTVADLRRDEAAYGPIPVGAAVLAWTGWDARWGTAAYPNLDADGVVRQPGFGVEAVAWLLATGRLGRRGALGTDTFGPDRGVDTAFAVSRMLYAERRISLENLTNLGALPPRGAWILVGGPINRRGSGSTATVFGLVPPGWTGAGSVEAEDETAAGAAGGEAAVGVRRRCGR